ncbi:hypothetical protein CJJ23_02735 [Mycoplasmopsis agassizii]|uniref:Uncharacterized protein n=1 Tax=Mycoplasmopsis agassizii TaxID=33922 RepID=A0A269TK67_9BACT|nr:hypothetical protein [Mycoplasmopsis agassizii]PAK21328.1 hypothetical protein CJJ23_02735 [Mycoplasmopsis agassizii]
MNNTFAHWINFYADDKKTLAHLKNIEKNLDKYPDFFARPYFNERGFSFEKGLGYNRFNTLTMSLVFQSFLNLIPENINLNILVAYNNDSDLAYYAELAQQIFSKRNFKVFLFERVEVVNSIINETYKNINLDAAIYLNYIKEQRKYKVTFLDGQANSIALEVYEKITENIFKLDPNQDIHKMMKAPLYLKETAIFDEYRKKVLSLSKRATDVKDLIIALSHNSQAFAQLSSKILGSLNFEYRYVSSNKILAPLIDNTMQLSRSAIKADADLLYSSDSGATFLNIAINVGSKMHFLEKFEFLTLFLDLYLLDKKVGKIDLRNKVIVLPQYLGILLDPIFKKYEVNWLAIEQNYKNEVSQQDILFLINKDNQFNFNTNLIDYFDHLQILVVFSELLNYYKTQKGSIGNVFKQSIQLYKPIFVIKNIFHSELHQVEKLLSYFDENKFPGEFKSWTMTVNPAYFIVQDYEKNILIKIEYEFFKKILFVEVYERNFKKAKRAKAVFHHIHKIVKAKE